MVWHESLRAFATAPQAPCPARKGRSSEFFEYFGQGFQLSSAWQQGFWSLKIDYCPRLEGSTPAKASKSVIRKSPVTAPLIDGSVGCHIGFTERYERGSC